MFDELQMSSILFIYFYKYHLCIFVLLFLNRQTGLAMAQVRHLTAALLAVALVLCSGPVSARVYQTDDAIIVEGKTSFNFFSS